MTVAGAIAAGRCACGAIDYRVDGELRDVINCHCGPCRQITGHFMAATSAAVTDLTINDGGTLRWFERTEDAHYGFCSGCGSTLFWRDATAADRVSIAAGSLDAPTGLRTTLALFGDHASDYHTLDPMVETVAQDRAAGNG